MFVVLVTGPPGAGKSEVATALHDSLGEDGIANALVELDELGRSYPPLDPGRALRNLERLCASFRESGHWLLLVTATVDDEIDANRVFEAAGADERMTVRLEAEPATLERRLIAREPENWPGLAELVVSARRLAASLAVLPNVDLALSTEEQAPDLVAARVKVAVLECLTRSPRR
jgi:predicted kinase